MFKKCCWLFLFVLILGKQIQSKTFVPVPWIPVEGMIEPTVWGDKKWGFADPDGLLMLELKYDGALAFSEGLAAVRDEANWGYIDKSGRMAIRAVFAGARFFRQGLAATATLTRSSNGLVPRWGFLDNRGRWAMEAKYDWAGDFGDGIAPVGEAESRKRERLASGQAVDRVKNMRFRFLDARGKTQIDPDLVLSEAVLPAGPGALVFEAPVGSFQEGLAPLYKKGRWGYVSRSNVQAIAFRFDEARGFSSGKAWVKENGLQKVIDKTGQTIFQTTGDFVQLGSFFTNQTAWAKKRNGDWGLFDGTGHWQARVFGRRVQSNQNGPMVFSTNTPTDALVEPVKEGTNE